MPCELPLPVTDRYPMSQPIIIDVSSTLRGLMPTFIERRAQELEAIRDAVSARDFDAIARIGHALRGSAGMYGFDALAEIAKRMETAAKAGDASSLNAIAGEIADYLARVKIRYV